MKFAVSVAVGASLLLSGIASGQSGLPTEQVAESTATPAVIRRFVASGLDEAIAYAELLDLKRTATAADTVDAVLDLVPDFGKATGLQPVPMSDIRATAMLFSFANRKAVVAFVEDSKSVRGSSGRHACRIVTDASKGKPDPQVFLILTRWCVHVVPLANIDANAIRK